MKEQFKGVICCGENISFPATVSYHGADYPVVTAPCPTGGLYLLAILDTAGDVVDVTPVHIPETKVIDKPLRSKPWFEDRISPDEPKFFFTVNAQQKHGRPIPFWFGRKWVRLTGYRIKTPDGLVYVPFEDDVRLSFKSVPDSRFADMTLRTPKTILSTGGNKYDLDVRGIIRNRTLEIGAFPPMVESLVFTSEIEDTPGLIRVSDDVDRICLIDLSEGNEITEKSIDVAYNGKPYKTSPAAREREQDKVLVLVVTSLTSLNVEFGVYLPPRLGPVYSLSKYLIGELKHAN